MYKLVIMCFLGSSSGMACQEVEVDNDSMIEGISDQVVLAVVLGFAFLFVLAYVLLR